MIPISSIQANVAASFRVPFHKMAEPINRGRGRDGRNAKNICIARQVGMYLTRELTDHSLSRIGYYFGRRDHSTVIHAIKEIEKKISADKDFAEKVLWNRNWIILSQSMAYPQGKAPRTTFVPCREEGKVAA